MGVSAALCSSIWHFAVQFEYNLEVVIGKWAESRLLLSLLLCIIYPAPIKWDENVLGAHSVFEAWNRLSLNIARSSSVYVIVH